jgi:hypothetical protein
VGVQNGVFRTLLENQIMGGKFTETLYQTGGEHKNKINK